MKQAQSRVRISFAAHLKPVPVAGFIFSDKTSVSSVSKVSNYRPPVLVKAKEGWYIKYYYRIPVDVRDLYDDREWFRFRVKEDMNRRQGPDREEYATWLLSEITNSLKKGYNPFAPEVEITENQASEFIIPDEISANDALLMFLEKWNQRGLAVDSYNRYKRIVSRLIDWLQRKKMLYGDVKKITVEHIEQFLSDMKTKYDYGNREYNNSYDFLRTAFNFLLKKKIIDESPCTGIDKLKAKTSKHRFYDEANLNAITKALIASDPYTYLAFQSVYYLCVRSDKELMNLKVGNIQWQENKILTEAEGSKGGAGRYIPMDENIKKLFLDNGIDKYPPHYYVFGIHGAPAEKPFGRGFFSKRFKKVRKVAGLPEWFSMYGAKHTRVLHLKGDGVSDANIMALTGHKDFTAYAKYLRDIGLTMDIKDLNAKSRKI